MLETLKTQGGSIEIPCIYNVVGIKQHQLKVRNILKKILNNGCFIRVIYLWNGLYSQGEERKLCFYSKIPNITPGTIVNA